MMRAEEIRFLNSLSEEEVIQRAGSTLKVFENADAIDTYLAQVMFEEITKPEKNSYIFPFGPSGQYPKLVDMLNMRKASINANKIFFMDEYADAEGKEYPESHPLSFKGRAMQFFSKIDSSLLPDKDVFIFPSSKNISHLADRIKERGGISVCFGGIGIHGHVAFNEPAEGVEDTDPYLVNLNAYTVTINAIREHTGGNIYNFPNKALTLGMKQVLGAKKIILSCRNGLKEIDWANTVLRIALFGQIGDDFPVTWLRAHSNYVILTDKDTLRTPINNI